MKLKKRKFATVLGYVGFFLIIAVTVTAAVLVYSVIRDKDDKIVSVVMICIILLLSLLCTVIDAVRRKLTVEKPVQNILSATEKIASGDFSARIEPSHAYGKYDELDLIAENINKTAIELSKNEVLKTDFISNVSHEFKTPLAIIQNYATSLQDGNLDAETKKKYCKTLVEASKKLTDLIVNILKLNKLENQNIIPEVEKFRLDENIAACVIDFEEKIEKKRISLDCDLDEITVESSPQYLEVVWKNLLSNAIKFTPEGGSINVSLKKQNGRAVVKVKDTGIGIPSETGRHIFDKFYQGDASHAKEGNGLGLALVKKVIDVLGGDISVESEYGKGSEFSVTLKGEVE